MKQLIHSPCGTGKAPGMGRARSGGDDAKRPPERPIPEKKRGVTNTNQEIEMDPRSAIHAERETNRTERDGGKAFPEGPGGSARFVEEKEQWTPEKRKGISVDPSVSRQKREREKSALISIEGGTHTKEASAKKKAHDGTASKSSHAAPPGAQRPAACKNG